MIVNGIELDFDITSPADVLRYKAAGEKMEAEARRSPCRHCSQTIRIFWSLCQHAECSAAAFR